MTENEISRVVVDASIHVHRVLGVGLYASVCEAVLQRELEKRGLQVQRQLPIAVVYDGK